MPTHDLLIVGGEDHKSGQADDIEQRHPRLEQWTRERFPVDRRGAYTWAGQVMEPVDGLAFIGRNPLDHENVYMVTGDSGNGMTHGTIAGMLITDLILGPAQCVGGSLRSGPHHVARVRRVREGSRQHGGAVRGPPHRRRCRRGGADCEGFRRGDSARARKVAAYRDATGALHERSAVCPHLGCIVAWNPGGENVGLSVSRLALR